MAHMGPHSCGADISTQQHHTDACPPPQNSPTCVAARVCVQQAATPGQGTQGLLCRALACMHTAQSTHVAWHAIQRSLLQGNNRQHGRMPYLSMLALLPSYHMYLKRGRQCTRLGR
jgi:hypothetical protein